MDSITTLATVPAVVALVTVLKQFGVTGRWATLAAVLLGVAVTAGSTYLDPGVWATVTDGLILGLGAAGVYDVAKTIQPENVVTVRGTEG